MKDFRKLIIPGLTVIIIMMFTWLTIKTDDEIYYGVFDFDSVSDNADTSQGVVTVNDTCTIAEGEPVAGIPALHIDREGCTAELEYDSDVDFTAAVYDGDELLQTFMIPAYGKNYSFNISSDRDMYKLRIDFLYPGHGTVTVKNVRLISEPFFYSDSLATGLLLSLVSVLIFLWIYKTGFMGKTDSERMVFFAVMAFAVLINYPFYRSYMFYNGSDISHHIARIEGTKNALISGQFPVQLYTDALGGHGTIASMYPNLFLYIPAFLRVCRVSISAANQIFMIMINTATMFTAWYCMKTVTGDRYSALLGMVLYCTMPYRLSCMYYRYALGEVLSIIFIPLVIAGLYEIIFGDKHKWPLLVLGLSGIMESHVLSMIITAGFCAAVVLIFAWRMIKEKRILPLIFAGLMTFVVNLGFIIPFLYYYTSDISFRQKMGVMDFSGAAVFIPQLFMMMAGMGGLSKGISYGISGESTLSMGLAGVLCLGLAIYCLIFKKEKSHADRFTGAVVILGALLMFMSTTWFPWKGLQKTGIVYKLVSMIQFPFRFQQLAEGCIVIAGAAAVYNMPYFRKHSRLLSGVLASAAVIGMVILSDSALMSIDLTAGKYTADVGTEYTDDYVPDGYDASAFQDTPVSSAKISDYERNGTETTFRYVSEADTYADVPLIMYKGYEAEGAGGKELAVSKGDGAMVRIALPAASSAAEVTLRYVQPWYFYVSYIVSAAAVIFLIFISIRHRRRSPVL